MKVIDLLNKIANDIDVPPKQIKYDDKIFEYKLWLEPNKYAYVENGKNNTLEEYCCFYDLNDEVEIIEEDKKLEKIKTLNATNVDIKNKSQVYDFKKEQMILDIQTLQHWINKIIDYLEENE